MNSSEAAGEAEDSGTPDRYLGIGGERLRYRDEGKGPAVLLVHGWALDLNAWDPQAEVLRKAFRVLRFDRRGFGGSSGRPDVQQDAQDILALCTRLHLDRIALVAHSQGTRPAIDFAASFPGRVACLILDGPPEFDPARRGMNLALEPFRELARTQGLDAFRAQWLMHPLMQLCNEGASARAALERIVRRYPGADLLGEPFPAPPGLLPKLGALVMPIMVLTGQRDLAERRTSADELARRLPSALRVEVERSGHLSNLDNPAAYNDLIIPFLLRHTGMVPV